MIFVFGFIVGAGVGFKILEWISTQVLVEAWENSYAEFQKSYPWSNIQQQLNQKLEEQKTILIQYVQQWLKDRVLKLFSFPSSTPTN